MTTHVATLPQFPDSPINEILSLVAAAPFTLAPEKEVRLTTLRDAHNIRVGVDSTVGNFWFAAQPDTGWIFLSVPALERLWAYAYAYAHIVGCIHAQSGSTNVIKLEQDKEGREAMNLLRWAHTCEQQQAQLHWPQELPRPQANATPQSLGFQANELFIAMLGWITLHETAHIVLKHQQNSGRPPFELIGEELAADDWSFEWVLDNNSLQIDQPIEFARRTTGIALALTVISTFEVYDRTFGETHPDPPDRLWRFLDKYVPREGALSVPIDFAWWVSLSIIKLHLDNGGIKTDSSIVYDTAPDCLADLLLTLKRHGG